MNGEGRHFAKLNTKYQEKIRDWVKTYKVEGDLWTSLIKFVCNKILEHAQVLINL